MRSIRRKAKSVDQDTGASMTSMLDIIFNILAFFVVTFNPPLPERNFDISLPPPKVDKEDEQQNAEDLLNPLEFSDVDVYLKSDENGELLTITLAGQIVRNSQELTNQLIRKSTDLKQFDPDGKGIEAVNLVCSKNLKYAKLIEIVDACYRAKIQKINFAETAAN